MTKQKEGKLRSKLIHSMTAIMDLSQAVLDTVRRASWGKNKKRLIKNSKLAEVFYSF